MLKKPSIDMVYVLAVFQHCLPVLSFCTGGWRVQDSLVVLHVHDTFCVQFHFCRKKFVG